MKVRNPMAGQSNRKVVKYRRKPKAAGLIFAIVIIYIVCFIVMYLSKSKVQTYEVEAGSLTTNSSYTGIAVRSEAVYRSEYSGNINYYQRENTRIKGNDTVYTVDETGRDQISLHSIRMPKKILFQRKALPILNRL